MRLDLLGTVLRPLLWFHLAVSPLVFVLLFREQFEFPKLLMLYALCGFAALLLCIALAMDPGRVWRAVRAAVKAEVSDPISLGMAAIFCAAVLSTVGSMSMRTSIFGAAESQSGLITVGSYVALYFITVFCLRTREQGTWALSALFVPVGVASIYAFVQLFGWDALAWNRTLTPRGILRPLGTLGHPNFLSAYLAMALPALWLGFWEHKRNRFAFGMAVIGALGALAVAAIFVAQSRGGWFALVCVVAWLAVFYARKATRVVKIALSGATIAVVGFFGALVALGEFYPLLRKNGFLGELRERIVNFVFLSPARAEYTAAGLRIFKKYPLFGSGVDTFNLAFQHERTPHYWIFEWAGAPNTAHNEFINIMATQGAVGLLALMLLLIGIAVTFRDAWTHGGRDDRPYLVAIGGVIVGFLAQNLSSFTVSSTGGLFVSSLALLSSYRRAAQSRRAHEPLFEVSASEASLFLLLAVLLIGVAQFYALFVPLDKNGLVSWAGACGGFALGCLAYVSFLPRQERSRWGAGLGVALVLSALFTHVIVRRVVASTMSRRALSYNEISPSAAVSEIERAISVDRFDDDHVMSAAAFAERIADQVTDRDVKRQYRALTIRAYDKCVRMVPANGAYHYALAVALARDITDKTATEPDRARIWQELDRALELEPNNVIFRAGAGATAIALGDLSRAWQLGQDAVHRYPGYAVFHYQLGHVSYLLGQYVDAARHLKIALEEKDFFMTTDRPEAQFRPADRETAKRELAAALARNTRIGLDK